MWRADFCQAICRTRRVQQGQSSRHTDPHPRDHLRQSTTRSGKRFCRHVAGAKIERGHRCRAGHDRGQPKTGGTRAGESGSDFNARTEPRRCAHDSWSGECKRAERKFRRTATIVHHRVERSDFLCRRLQADIVAYKNGAPIRLGDVANIVDSVENDQLAAWVGTKDGEKPAVLLDIQRQPGANIIQTVERVKQLLPRLTDTCRRPCTWMSWLIAPKQSARRCTMCNSPCCSPSR